MQVRAIRTLNKSLFVRTQNSAQASRLQVHVHITWWRTKSHQCMMGTLSQEPRTRAREKQHFALKPIACNEVVSNNRYYPRLL